MAVVQFLEVKILTALRNILQLVDNDRRRAAAKAMLETVLHPTFYCKAKNDDPKEYQKSGLYSGS